MEFNLQTYFNAFDLDKDYGIDFPDVDAKLESVTEILAENAEAIYHNNELFEDIVDLCHSFKSLDSKHQKQLTYLIASCFNSVNHLCNTAVESGDYLDVVASLKKSLERYGYLIFVLLTFLGKEDYSGITKGKQSSNNAQWKLNCSQVETCLDAITNALQVDLSKIFLTTPEKELYLELFMRPIFHLMEALERMKQNNLKILMFKNVALAVKTHSYASSIESQILQSLTYYVHLAPYMAELLYMISNQYDYVVLTEEVLREISQIEFNANDSNGPKSIAEFLIKLSELSPRLILKQMSSVALLLDNSNMTLRCSVVETCGNIVVDIVKNDKSDHEEGDQGKNDKHQVDGLIELLEERFLDQNPYVRTKAIQALTKLCSLNQFTSRRQKMVMLAVRSMGDRSTLVRRNSIKFLSKLVLTNPFSPNQSSQLDYQYWKTKCDQVEAELDSLLPQTAGLDSIDTGDEDGDGDTINQNLAKDDEDHHDHDNDDDGMDIDEVMNDDDDGDDDDGDDDNKHYDEDEQEISSESKEDNRVIENIEGIDINVLMKLKLTIKYYQDAVEFIEYVEEGIKVASQLLFSKNRNEVLESMDFLVLGDAYNVRGSNEGIRKMLHLVWMKGSSDEGKSIASHLIECYTSLFLTAPSTMARVQQSAYIAKNLMSLTASASVADLASLEKLLCLMYDEELIAHDVIQVLWQVYGYIGTNELASEDNRKKSIQAIIILGMLALTDHNIVLRGLESLLNIGLGPSGRRDIMLAKYTCIALQRIVPLKGSSEVIETSKEESVISKLKLVMLEYSDDVDWFSVAEECIGAIFQISSKPDIVASEIIIAKSKLVFQKEISEGQSRVIGLSQLLFMVGHIAIKTIVYLEKLEAQFKKKKHDSETKKNTEQEDEANELEMIGGTTEDDFTDAVIFIKERQLLFGDDSLLAKFGPFVTEICSNNKQYDDERLQRSAVLCLAKLMCISSKYCEDNLPLLITIMEKSPDPIIRSNCVLGLGDMAVCFNNLVDENTDFLYRRLSDENIMVQRTCLMTVTFLILAGQVKVKGQLSSMAKCLENPDQGISDMCRLFFTELATKDNAIYNGFIDIFSGLSNDESLSKESMKRIVKFLVGFIEKEKHQKQLAEKLLNRLTKSQNEIEWNDLAYVLNVIPYKSESITQALEGGYKLVSARQ